MTLSQLNPKELLKGRMRLMFDYILLAVALLLGGFAITLWGQKKATDIVLTKVQADLVIKGVELKGVKGSLAAVEKVNQSQQDTIEQLKNLRNLDSNTILSLQKSLEGNRKTHAQRTAPVTQLRKTNETVDHYLANAIPAKLRDVLQQQERELHRPGN